MNQNIILMGPPGSGKGTQAKRLASKLNMVYFGAGDMIREEIVKKSQMGQRIKSIVEKGQIISDEDITQLVEICIKNRQGKGIVFDGFPRVDTQAYILDEMLPNDTFKVINIIVKKESLIKRMEKRWVCADCGKIFIIESQTSHKKCDDCGGNLVKRSDDNLEILAERIKVYERQTLPLTDLYGKKGILINIDGEPLIDEVEKEIWQEINK